MNARNSEPRSNMTSTTLREHHVYETGIVTMVAVQTTCVSDKEGKSGELVIAMETEFAGMGEQGEKYMEVAPPSGGASCVIIDGQLKSDDVAVRQPFIEPSTKKDDDVESGSSQSSLESSTIEAECRNGRWGLKSALKGVIKVLGLLLLLYFFVCSLDLMSTAFKLLSGKYTGSIFSKSEILSNPVAGLMVGVLATVLVQSSSTSTSIVVTMVASGIVDVKTAIPIIMGANVGTSVTNTLVSMTQAADREVFERAFAGATVHDMFNWLTVIVLLPLEVTTGALYRLTSILVSSQDLTAGKYKKQDLLKVITKPLTSRIVQLDKKVLKGLALGDEKYFGKSMIKRYNSVKEAKATTTLPTSVPSTAEVLKIAGQDVVFAEKSNNLEGVRIAGQRVNWPTSTMEGVASTLSPAGPVQMNETIAENGTTSELGTKFTGSLFSLLDIEDTTSGIILLIVSLMLLCVCLVCIVKLLQSMMKSKICGWIKKMVNAEFPGCFRHLTGYVAILLGAILTIVVQSSSVFTSTLTPLVGVGLIEIERMYPLTLGSNIGTTMTGILAALAASRSKLGVALQIALCHLFFNIIGILIFYPIPALRRLPLRAAKFLGRITAKYRWFCIVYLILMFLILPLIVFSLSLAGKFAVIIAVAIAATLVCAIIILNVLQNKCKDKLPKFLQSWKFLPKFLRSLEPYDSVICRVISFFGSICPCCRKDANDSDNQKEATSLLQRENVQKNLTISSPDGKSKPDIMFLNESPNSSNLSSESSLNSFWSSKSDSPIVKKEKSKRTRV